MKMGRVESALRHYEDALRLAVAPLVKSSNADGTLGLRLLLTNRSSTTIRACLGSTRAYTLIADPIVPGRKPLDSAGSTVDHPYCDRQFELAPAQKLEWVEQVTLDIGPGLARLLASVQIVHPHDCDRYGCYDTMLKASEVRFIIE